ncbi:MAG: winged helix-turn-helix domain-containing protein [Candidatus Acidiferrales bacterium]
MDSSKGSKPRFTFGPYEADLRAGELRKGGTRVKIQDLPLRLLGMLAEKPGGVITREDLQKYLWPSDTFVDFEDGLHTAVRKLREALCDDSEKPRYVETVPRRGYRFLAEVKTCNDYNRAPQTQAAHSASVTGRASAVTDDLSKAARLKPLGTVGRSWRIWLSFAALVMALFAFVATWLLRQRPVLSFSSRDSVLVADFENETGDPRFDRALQTAFTVSLEQSRNANVFSRLRLPDVLHRMGRAATDRITPNLGREICQRENIRGLIACSITRTGQEYALTAELIDPQNGATLRSYTERTSGEGTVLNALDSLSQKIRADLGESLYQIHAADSPLPEVTTKSLSALKDYADGVALWEQGKFNDAMPLFRAAVATDPGFAMAHAALAGAYHSFIYNEQPLGQQEYEKALALTDRVTDRERMIINAKFADDTNHTDAASLYELYLYQYPNDWNMLLSYAHLLRMHGHAPEAIKQYQQVLRVAPDDASTYVELATAYSDLHDFPNALHAYSQAFQLEPELLTAGNTNREYGAALVDAGQPQKAEQVFSALLAEPESRENGLRSLALLDLYYGRYARAQRQFEDALAIDDGKRQAFGAARVRYMLAEIAGGEGNRKKQIAELDAVMPSFKYIGPKVLYGALIGQAYARAGATNQAEKILTIITPLADAQNSQQTKCLHLLQAEIALAKGSPRKALELIDPPTSFDGASVVELLTEFMAYANQRAGNTAAAIQWYERLLAAFPGWSSWEPQQRCIDARYFLAEDYLAEGDPDKANTTLGALLKLWSDADVNLPLRKQALQLNARIAK